jgi:hypothetical protein
LRRSGERFVAKRISKAEARRRAALIREKQEYTQPQIGGENLTRLLRFEAQMAPREHREAVRVAVVEVCGRATHITGRASFVKRMSDVSALATWAATNGRSTQWRDLMDHRVIHDYGRESHDGVTEQSLIGRVGRLRALASKVHPSPAAPPAIPAGARTRLKPPYTSREDAALLRMARGQARPERTRKLLLLIGLARGAGASSADLRIVEVTDIVDHGRHGIDVALGTGDSRRVVPVRRTYEAVVREGLKDATQTGLLFGQGGKNAINEVVGSAVVLSSDVPRLEVGRLRTTWIAELMHLPIPLSTLMTAAGLQGARTFADIWEAMYDAGQMQAADLRATR